MFVLTSLVTVVVLIVYFVIVINVGRARRKYGVPVPQTSGNLDFERALRVQQNTVEQIVLFIPALWLFSYYISPVWGAILGTVWIVGRIIYAWGYYQAAEKRLPGFAIASLSTIALIIGSLVGVVLNLAKL
jgi:glutathione S-transferase